MNILLLTPVSGLEKTKGSLSTVKMVLEKQGHKVNSDVLEGNLSQLNSEENIVNVYKKIDNSLKNSDMVIAEISEPSSGIGYLTANALTLKKPVLILFNEAANTKPPIPLRASKSKLLTFTTYNRSNLESIVLSFVKEAKQKLDTKFILIISAEIDRYLEWAADMRRMHKAQVVREAVEAAMKKDKEYKNYLNNQ